VDQLLRVLTDSFHDLSRIRQIRTDGTLDETREAVEDVLAEALLSEDQF